MKHMKSSDTVARGMKKSCLADFPECFTSAASCSPTSDFPECFMPAQDGRTSE